jgi:hypothetical protein
LTITSREKQRFSLAEPKTNQGTTSWLLTVKAFLSQKVGARIRGDDPWFDDRLFSIGGTGIERVLPDGSFTLSKIVPGSQLNEDWGRDEIYALVDVEGLSGTFKSNTVTGHF